MKKFLLNFLFVISCVISFSQISQNKGNSNFNLSKEEIDVLKVHFEDKNGPYKNFSIEQEEVSLRTENSKHFRNSNGTMTAIVGAGPIHYKENGQWKTILSHVDLNKTGQFKNLHFAAVNNKHKIFFPAKPGSAIVSKINNLEYSDWGKPTLVWLDINGNVISEVLPSNTSSGVAKKDVLTYKEIFPNIDAEIINSTTTKKLSYLINNPVVINNRPAGAVYLAFKEEIVTPSSWLIDGENYNDDFLTLNRDKLFFKNFSFIKNSVKTIEIQTPVYHDKISLGNCNDIGFDTAKTNTDGYVEGKYMLRKLSTGKYLNYILVPVDWLTSPQRKFPLTIDPVANYYPGGTWPTHTANRSGNSGSWACYVGTYAGRTYTYDISYGWIDDTWPFSNPYMDGYASFDISAIPDNSVINSAVTYWYRYSGRTCDNPIVLKHGRVQYNEYLANQPSCDIDGIRVRNNNSYYNGTGKNGTGWQNQSASTTDVTNALAGDQITMGWAYDGGDDCCTFLCGGNDGDYHHIYGYQHSTLKPYIVIDYCVKPVITTQPAGYNRCKTNSMTALTVTATGTGLTYQWQSSNYTSCSGVPSSSWLNVSGTGSTSTSYTPPKIAGTRLYRVIVTADCPSSVSGRSVTSNCVVVTVNPMDGSASGTTLTGHPYNVGDNPPAIQSGICGNTILPSSSNVLNVLLPNAIGAVNNITTYSWAASGGTFSSTTGNPTTWTAPSVPGNYSITLTYIDACAETDAQTVCNVTVGSPACDYVYVSTTGTDDINCGGPDNPCRTLSGSSGAIVKISGSRNYVRMATGSYTEANIVDLITGITIEGRYTVSNGIWSKSSSTGASTSITCQGTGNGTDATTQQHVMGFRSNSNNNWKLIDLNITTSSASGQTSSGRGKSNYGIWINNSSGFEINRCYITSGAATAGVNGTVGSAGSNGSAGGNGFNGSCDGGHGNGASAVTGPGSGTQKGGNGGAGGRGGTEGNNSGVAGSAGGAGGGGASGDPTPGAGGGGGDPGKTGGSASASISTSEAANGTTGSTGSAGAAGTFSTYFIPGAQAGTGNNGTGGGGGAGGGGGGGQGCFWCNGGNGAGAGGAGGEGGDGGTGGWGGGSSFSIYLTSIASSGTLNYSTLSSGTAGSGGTGGAGGAGGIGGNGGTGAANCTGEIGRGGNGSKGGNGGSGGSGGVGAAGASYQMYTVGGSPLNTSPSVAVPNSPVVTIAYQNGKICANSVLTVTKNAAGSWTLPSGWDWVKYNNTSATSQYSAGTVSPSDITTTVTSGSYDLIANGTVFNSYLTVRSSRTAPTITIKANDNTTLSPAATICDGGTVKLTATSWGTEQEFLWEIFDATNAPNKGLTSNRVYVSTSQSPVTDALTNSGTTDKVYLVRYQVREECCGWCIPRFTTITVKPNPTAPTNFTITGPNASSEICVPNTISASSPTGSLYGITPYTYEWDYDNSVHPYNIPVTGSTLSAFASAVGENKIRVRVKAIDLKGCNESDWFEKIVIGNEVPVGDAVTITPCSGSTVSQVLTTSNGVTGTTFQIVTTPTNASITGSLTISGGNALGGVLTNSSASDITLIYVLKPIGPGTTFCNGANFNVTVIVRGKIIPAVGSNSALCDGGDLNLTASATGGGGSYIYNWSGPNSFSNSSQNPVRTAVITTDAGNYTVTITDANACTVSATTSVSIVADPIMSNASLSNTTICSGGTSNITSNLTGGTGTMNPVWEYYNGTSWNTVGTLPAGVSYSNSSSATMTISSIIPAGSYQYRRNLFNTSVGCDATGNSATLMVIDDPAWGTNNVTPTDACLGANVTLSASVVGGSGNIISWIKSTTSGGAGTTVTSPNTITSLGTYYFRPVYTSTVSGCDLIDGAETIVTITQPNLTNINSALPTPMVSGDYLWHGLVSNSWVSVANWYVLNGSNFDLASVIPTTADNVFIVSNTTAQQCVSNTNIATIVSANTGNANSIYIGSGATLDELGTLNIYGNYTNDGALGISSGTRTIIFKGNATQLIKSGGTGSSPNKRFVNIIVDKSGGSVSQSPGNTGDVYTTNITFTNGTWDNRLNNNNMTVTGVWTNTSSNSGYIPGTGAVIFNSSTNRTIFTGWNAGSAPQNKSFYNLTKSGTATHTLSGNLNVENNISITAGSFSASSSNYNINVGGNWSNSSGSIFLSFDGSVNFVSGGNKTIVLNGNKFYIVNILKDTGYKISLSDNFEALDKVTIISGTLEVPSNIIGKSKQMEIQFGSYLNILLNGQFRVNE
jgi:hypothetical protein